MDKRKRHSITRSKRVVRNKKNTRNAVQPQSNNTNSAARQQSSGVSSMPPARRGAAQRPIDIFKIPITFDHIGNLFESARPGDAVTRAEDLLALRIERRNLKIVPGSPPRLVKEGRSVSYLILHFPPQSIVEQAFYQAQPQGTDEPDNPHAENSIAPQQSKESDPAANDTLGDLPVRARIAGESRLVFRIPEDFDIPYTLTGVLEACMNLVMRVASSARPPASRSLVKISKLFQARQLNTLTNTQKAALAGFALRSLRMIQQPNGIDIIRLRSQATGMQLKAIPEQLLRKVPDLSYRPNPPKPKLPTATQTAIELPWRLIVSPHSKERWQHALTPVTSAQTGHTELWHSRLTAPDANGVAIEPPHSDPQRTIRAVWALSGEYSTKSMHSNWPGSDDIPAPTNLPFRMPLSDFDRFQITHLSSNFSVSNYTPEPIDTNLVMLSALGGWLDSRGGWEPPGLSVEEWVHRASMARDHYVRVVYRGCLVPFGHRVSLVKVTERKFHNGKDIEFASGNTAYMRQRLFIVVRERERRFDLPGYANLQDNAGARQFLNQFPFVRVSLLTQNTPDLDKPETSPSAVQVNLSDVQPQGNQGQLMFWPHVGGQAFKFQCMAEDLDGNTLAFELPMLFMDNTKMGPLKLIPPSDALQPDWGTAESNAQAAKIEYASKAFGSGKFKEVAFKKQRVALAGSLKPGDTSVQAEQIIFGLEAEKGNQSLRNASNQLQRPVFFPKFEKITARIGALSHLTGSTKTNTLEYNSHFLEQGFDANKGQVFVDVKPGNDMAVLDFSAQGDRSGGFVQPNIKPNVLSRVAGPVMGNVQKFIDGKTETGSGFPTSIGDLPLPLLFGCIPLGELIDAVSDMDSTPERIPKFASEASTQLETFVNGLGRLFTQADQLSAQPGDIAAAALSVFEHTIDDLLQQSEALSAAQKSQIQTPLQQLIAASNPLQQALTTLSLSLSLEQALAAPQLSGLSGLIANVDIRITDVSNAANAQISGVSLPAGLRQSVHTVAQQMGVFLDDLAALPGLLAQAKNLYDALDAIIGDPGNIGTLFSDPILLNSRLEALKLAIGPFKSALLALKLLEGAPRKVIIDALTVVEQVLGGAVDLLKLVEMLTGDELTIRFDWNPEISSWGLVGGSQSPDPLFRANNKRGFLVAVEAKVKKNGSSAPKIGVVCSLKHFDLVLIAPASFLELNFEKIQFSVNSAAKMDVDVLLSDIKFVGPLSFVETLRDLIPLDGFSDPPYLDISPQGIDAGFDVALPGISVGVLNIHNLSLGAGFTVPFIGQPLSVRFNFCTREQPFTLTVYVFGGGGFFGVTIDPHGVQILEAAFEFGASVSIDLGVASGGVHIMAGLYYRMEMDASTLSGYFRLGGHVDVLGLITASLELYLEIRYEMESGKCVGKAQLTIEIEVFIFSGSVTVTCERKFAGSNGDPTLRQMLGFAPELSLPDELALIQPDSEYAWREYNEAFA